MFMHHRLYPICAFVLSVAVPFTATTTRAAEENAIRIAQLLAPVVDDQTLVVIRVELANLQPAAAIQQVADLLKSKGNGTSLGTPQDQLAQTATRLMEAGAREMFVVISLENLPQLDDFLTIVPVMAGVDAAAVEQVLAPRRGTGIAARRQGNLLLFAPRHTLERVQQLKPVARAELAAAFAAVEGNTVQLLVLPSSQTRRVIEEIMPTLPQDLGGAASRIFTQGITWAAAGIDLAPKKLDAHLVIQSSNVEAAAGLNTELAELLKSLGQLASVQQMLPKFADVVKEFQPTVAGDRLTLQMTGVSALTALLAPPVDAARLQAGRSRSMNNLKQIMLGMFNYLDAAKPQSFPPRATYTADGKQLLSWRVHILPYLDQAKLYKEFHLDEPWDSEHNRKLIERMPETLRSPLSSAPAGRTTYVVPIVEKGVFAGKETLQLKQITDGTSNTIAVVEADDDHAVIWTKPDDIEIDLTDPFRGLVNPALHGFFAALCDGSVRLISDKTDVKNLGRLFKANDGEPLERLP